MAQKVAKPLSKETVSDSSDDEDSSSADSAARESISSPSKSVNGQSEPKSKDDSRTESDESAEDEDSAESSVQKDAGYVAGSSGRKRASRPGEQGAAQKSRKKTKPPFSIARIAPKPFKAPSGFEPLTQMDSDHLSDLRSFLGDLSAQQIWHISAPATLQIEAIKELDIQAALRGESILNENGISYNMQQIPPPTTTTMTNDFLLVPSGADGTYKQSQARISRTFCLREMTSKGSPDERRKASESTDGHSALTFTAQHPGGKRKPRSQPEGLKMRYVPYGAVDGSQEGPQARDVEMSDALTIPEDEVAEQHNKTPKHKRPKDGKEAKREGERMERDEDTALPVKKSQTTLDSSQPSSVDGSSGTPREKKKKKKKTRLVEAGL